MISPGAAGGRGVPASSSSPAPKCAMRGTLNVFSGSPGRCRHQNFVRKSFLHMTATTLSDKQQRFRQQNGITDSHAPSSGQDVTSWVPIQRPNRLFVSILDDSQWLWVGPNPVGHVPILVPSNKHVLDVRMPRHACNITGLAQHAADLFHHPQLEYFHRLEIASRCDKRAKKVRQKHQIRTRSFDVVSSQFPVLFQAT